MRPAEPATGPDAFGFTAVLTFADSPSGGTRYRALVRHADDAGRRRHEEMGFHEGWGAAFDQLVAMIHAA